MWGELLPWNEDGSVRCAMASSSVAVSLKNGLKGLVVAGKDIARCGATCRPHDSILDACAQAASVAAGQLHVACAHDTKHGGHQCGLLPPLKTPNSHAVLAKPAASMPMASHTRFAM